MTRVSVRFVTIALGAIAACQKSPDVVAPLLPGTSWVLEESGGIPAVERGRATLQFEESGRASGNGSCNRFSGTASFAGDSLAIGPLLSTKMACVEEPLNAQETRFMGALEAARRYEIRSDTLLIFGDGNAPSLRLTRAR